MGGGRCNLNGTMNNNRAVTHREPIRLEYLSHIVLDALIIAGVGGGGEGKVERGRGLLPLKVKVWIYVGCFLYNKKDTLFFEPL